jgi:hypothetical protein
LTDRIFSHSVELGVSHQQNRKNSSKQQRNEIKRSIKLLGTSIEHQKRILAPFLAREIQRDKCAIKNIAKFGHIFDPCTTDKTKLAIQWDSVAPPQSATTCDILV